MVSSETFRHEALEEARVSLSSTRGKCEKALAKLREGSSQHTLLVRRVNALSLALVLIDRELATHEAQAW